MWAALSGVPEGCTRSPHLRVFMPGEAVQKLKQLIDVTITLINVTLFSLLYTWPLDLAYTLLLLLRPGAPCHSDTFFPSFGPAPTPEPICTRA